ncbi:MAG: hypothetical protein JNM88_13195 [Chitinophagaceae bacterium]|nr:hypothetical protein [Chitinophagaceae bacterium]
MTYFEMFDIPVQLAVDTAPLARKFFELSRLHHPDYFANDSEEKQAAALEQSALLNKAWKTFQQPDETIRYVLMQKGILQEEEKYELSPFFLAEVLELNEALMDADEPGAAASLAGRIEELRLESYAPVKEIIEHYQDGITTEKELLQVKEYYFRKKYLDRMKRQLAL